MNLGDKVKVIKPGIFVHPAAQGQVGVIVGVVPFYEVRGPWLKENYAPSLMEADEFELVEETQVDAQPMLIEPHGGLKPGDVVRHRNNPAQVGEVILLIPPEATDKVWVEWEPPVGVASSFVAALEKVQP